MSSHSAACLAAAKAFESEHISVSAVNSTLDFIDFINTVKLIFIKKHAEEIMKASSIRYVRDAKLRDSLFNSKNINGLVSSAETDFWVDHIKSLEALTWAQDAVG